ncbi:hypothetical protein CFP56_010345 [Quercus suber]|uniref:Disease resistance N-terminal domain-containing protein n=1 Tax=Quercus suber TaxID=58331 RepID=A0AAW0KYZ2_QUESU
MVLERHVQNLTYICRGELERRRDRGQRRARAEASSSGGEIERRRRGAWCGSELGLKAIAGDRRRDRAKATSSSEGDAVLGPDRTSELAAELGAWSLELWSGPDRSTAVDLGNENQIGVAAFPRDGACQENDIDFIRFLDVGFDRCPAQKVEQEIRLVICVDKEIRKLEGNLQTVKAVLNDAEKRQVTEGAVKIKYRDNHDLGKYRIVESSGLDKRERSHLK